MRMRIMGWACRGIMNEYDQQLHVCYLTGYGPIDERAVSPNCPGIHYESGWDRKEKISPG